MALHLQKLSVGVEDIGHLRRLQAARLERARAEGRAPRLFHLTRMTPARREEVLEGGSIYWVVRGVMCVRQRILDLEPAFRETGEPACAIILDPLLTETLPRPCRPFQGWRYLAAGDAPPDRRRVAGDDEMPPELVAELRSLGLL